MYNCLQKIIDYLQLLNHEEDGQAITEYAILVVLFVGVTSMLVVLLRIFSSYGWRILNLIGSDFP
jgi:hypothetical protein